MSDSKSNEHRWQKGESGNPNGRPRSAFSFKRGLELKASQIDPKDRLQRTYGQQLIDRAFDLALRGPKSSRQVRAISEILDRVLGKPVQAVAVADMRPESREQLIESILATAQAMKEDEPTTIH